MHAKNSKTTKSRTKRASRIVLGENLEISGATKLHARLKTCTAKGIDVNLSAAGVESIDTSCMQLLLTFVQQLRNEGHSVNWQKPSEVLLKTATLAGLSRDLGLVETAEKS